MDQPDFTPRTLLLGPLGSRSFSILGFLLSLDQSMYLESIDTYAGVSVGAIISLLLIIGCDVKTVIEYALKINVFGCMEDFLSIMSKGGFSSLANKGVLDLSNVREILNEAVISKIGYVPTLQILYNLTGKSLITFSLDIKENKTKIFTPSKDPQLNCVEAVLNAINLPFIFKQNNSRYIDLYFSNCYPIDYFDDGVNDVLGIYTISQPERNQFPTNSPTTLNFGELNSYLFRDMSPYIFNLVNSILDQRREENILKCSSKCRNIKIIVTLSDPLGYSSSISDLGKMIVDGYELGLKYVDGELDFPEKRENWKYDYPEYLLVEESEDDNSSGGIDIED